MQSLITVRDVAPVLGVSQWRVYDMVRQGIIPRGVVVHVGRTLRFNPVALQDFIAAGGKANEARPDSIHPDDVWHTCQVHQVTYLIAEGGCTLCKE